MWQHGHCCCVPQALAAAWQAAGMVAPEQFVGVCGFSSVDWAVSDMAATFW